MIWRERGFYGLRIGRLFLKAKRIAQHPLLFSERQGIRCIRLGGWLFGWRWETPSRIEIRGMEIRGMICHPDWDKNLREGRGGG